MNRKIIFLINPIAGTKGKEDLKKIIEEKTGALSIPFEIMPTNAAGEYSFLKEKIYSENITDIVICGGDGTINQVAAALMGLQINIGIIPMGSGNGLAFSAKIPKNPGKALDIIFNGKAHYIDAFYINAAFSCMLCGLGFDAQVAHDFAKQKKRGLVTYIKLTVSNFYKAKTYPFSLSLNENTINTEAYFISIANSNQFGNNFTIAPKASLNDGLLDIVVVKKMNKFRLLWSLYKQVIKGTLLNLQEENFHDSNVVYFQTGLLSINNPAAAPLHIDGDPVETSDQFLIKIIPHAFRLIQP